MSNFLNKIPVSPITSFGNSSVPNGSTIGTNFSILQTGGFMEVYTLSGLTYTIPPATTGIIEFSGNSIPIQFTKGSGSVFSPDVLTLNSDNISSGRRKLGMLAYVYETNKIYQFRIDNYDTLWGNATGATGMGGPTVVISDFGTTVKNNSAAGIAFINAWTASTISGIGGYDDTNASWRVLSTGGGTSVTGGTFNNNTDTLTLNNSIGGTITITGFTDYYTTGFTFNPASYDLTIKRNDGLPDLSVNLSILSSDVTITGGTYNSSTGTATFTNNTGGTFNVTGFLTGFTDIYVTGGTFNKNIETLTLTRTDGGQVIVSGFTDVFVTGGTKTGNNVVFTNNTGGTFTVTGFTDTFVTGATYSNNTFTYRNNTGGTFSVLFNTMTGLTATTISATTYQNLPTDIRVTGGTYSASTGITTFVNNTGGTFTVSGYYTPSNDIYVSGGTIGNGPDTADNKITLNRTDGNTVTLTDLVDIVNLTKSEMDTIIGLGKVIRGKTYKISNCDTSLYNNGTDSNSTNVYTTIYLLGLENNKLSEIGIGIFYTPKYNNFDIFVDGKPYSNSDNVIWGGFVWQLKGGSGTYNSIDIFTLPGEFDKNYPFNESDNYESTYYNEQYDDIIYDYTNDRIIYRNEENSNIVSTTYENINYWITVKGFWNPIRVFQWGHLVDSVGVGVIYNQQIINSYNENINYLGQYQTDFYFNNLSYQIDFYVDEDSYQSNFIFDNQSYQNDITISGASYQSGITLNNNSYQYRIDIFGYSGYPANQSYFNFNNGSYHSTILLESIDGKPSIQNYFNFNNNSYQNNIDLTGKNQINLDFTNNSGQSNLGGCGQNSLIFDSSTQINGTNITQQNITIKNYDRDLTSVTGSEGNRFFIHDLPTDNTAPVYIGKINNQLVQVTKPTDIFVTGGTYSGSTIIFRNNSGGTFNVTGITTSSTFTGGTVTGATSFTGGLTANTISATTYQNLPIDVRVTGSTYSNNTFTYTNNTGGTFNVLFNTVTGLTVNGNLTVTGTTTSTTISATTYQNLPVSGVTGGTGISANTTNGLVTIVNTAPDQVVTISGGTGISTGGTYPNFVLTNTSPDQTVTITGGTNIEIEGTYPNFGINFTGSTGASGDFLPLSGGTVSGATTFTGGLTANTISATTYFNLPTDIRVTGGTYDTGSSSITFTNNTGGTFNVSGITSSGGGSFTGGTVSGPTTFTNGLTANTISATTYFNLPTDVFVTGGTYSNGTATFTNNTGGTFNVTGLYTGGTDVFVTGATKSGDIATFTNNTGGTFTLTGLTDTFVTGGTYDTGSSSITFTNNSGGTFNVSGITSSGGGSFTGGTVSGATSFTGGLTANTISATTITSPSISPYGLIVATSIGYQNIF